MIVEDLGELRDLLIDFENVEFIAVENGKL